MEPNLERGPRLIQPSAAAEKPLPQAGYPESSNHSPEAMIGGPESKTATPTDFSPPAVVSLPDPLAAMTQAIDQPATVTTTAIDTDDDLTAGLDQEWVDRAKAIVERTKDDPYQESREIGQVKADYLRIRYNKQVNVAEDKPK